jgi:hypothetical protein
MSLTRRVIEYWWLIAGVAFVVMCFGLAVYWGMT